MQVGVVGTTQSMAEKSRQEWTAAVRRWSVVGLVFGFAFGCFAHFAWDGSSGLAGLLAALAFYVPMGAGVLITLWAAMYKYDFANVWGWSAMGLTFGLIALLIATSIGVGCLQGICGER